MNSPVTVASAESVAGESKSRWLALWLATVIGSIGACAGAYYAWALYREPKLAAQSPSIAEAPIGSSVAASRQKNSAAHEPDKSQALASAQMQYDALRSRFTAVEGSLKSRMQDLGSQPVKPEIATALQLTRSDLAEVQAALASRNPDGARARLARIEQNLAYLEKL